MTKATTTLITATLVIFSSNLSADLEWSIEFEDDAPGKLVWQTDPDLAYNLWHSETLSEPFVHVDGFPKDGTGGVLEHLFNPGTRGFFRIDSAPLGFALIPAGRFEMGDSYDEGDNKESPVHTVFVSAFCMETKEVSFKRWTEVRTWGKANGYDDLPAGKGKADDHAAHSISWWDAMKWCNARSEREGRSPCYFEDDDKTDVYRKGNPPRTKHERVDWSADGYRLPTEAEWEKAARGGLAGRRFPWGDTISHDLANYYSNGPDDYDLSLTSGAHPNADDSKIPYSLPVASFAPNNYGLYDMAGGVWEWCWDAYDSDYYDESPEVDPRGPDKTNSRMIRGGAWSWSAFEARCSFRKRGWKTFEGADDRYSFSDYDDQGFRVVCGR